MKDASVFCDINTNTDGSRILLKVPKSDNV